MTFDELLRKLRRIGANPRKIWVPGPMASFILGLAQSAVDDDEDDSEEDGD